MNIIPLGLFLLGVIFLLIGWRWQSPHSEENVVALKGLAYLRSEILRVQNQVHVLEDELLETKRLYKKHENQTLVDHHGLDIRKKDQKEVASEELEHQVIRPERLAHQEIKIKEPEFQEIELKVNQDKDELKKVEIKETKHLQKAKLYSISPQEQRERSSKPGKRLFDEKAESARQDKDRGPQAEHQISGKFREVLELAARGQRIPEIAQNLFISQDAVRMVLSMQSKEGTR